MRWKSALPIIASALVAVIIIAVTGTITWMNDDINTAQAGPSSAKTIAKIQEQVFPKDKVIDVKVTLDKDDFQDMIDNASAEEMKTASVEYNGIKFDNVGIRTKGNLSLRSVVNTDSERYSFKLSFDEYVNNQTLYGISKINLNNNYSDASYMREFLTYELAETMGLPTPGYSYVNLYVNGELKGCYLAVEQIGTAYLERHFGNSYGALYKAEMSGNGGDLGWYGNDLDSYGALVLKSETSNGDVLLDMLNELNNGSDYESVLDVEQVLKYIALNVVTVNWDSYLGSNKQNYYLYENDGVFSVLPWDFNMAFGGGPGGSSILIDEPTQGSLSERPLIAKLLAVDAYKEKYHALIQTAIEGYLSDDNFKARVQELSALISSSVEQDPTAFYTYEQYQNGVQSLISFNASTVQNIAGQLDGSMASTNDGNGSGGGMGGFGGFGGGRGGMNGGISGERTDMPEGTNSDRGMNGKGDQRGNGNNSNNQNQSNNTDKMDTTQSGSMIHIQAQDVNNGSIASLAVSSRAQTIEAITAALPLSNDDADMSNVTPSALANGESGMNNATSPAMPNGESGMSNATPPAMPNGESGMNNGAPPAMPNGVQQDGTTSPTLPSGEQVNGQTVVQATGQDTQTETGLPSQDEQHNQQNQQEQQLQEAPQMPEGFDPTQMGQQGNMQPPEGFDPSQMGGQGGMQRPGGFGGGNMGDMMGRPSQAASQGSLTEAITVLIAVAALVLASLFVVFFRRRH